MGDGDAKSGETQDDFRQGVSRMPIKGKSKVRAIKLAALAAVAIAAAGILVLAHFETMRFAAAGRNSSQVDDHSDSRHHAH